MDAIKKILFCTDFSANCDSAFDYALGIAEPRKETELVIFHVIPEPDAQFWKTYLYEIDSVDEKAKTDIDAKIEKAYTSKIPDGISWRSKMSVGGVDQKILEAVREEAADLVILGRQGSSNLRTLFYGATAQHIALKSPCPVLIIPAKPTA